MLFTGCAAVGAAGAATFGGGGFARGAAAVGGGFAAGAATASISSAI